MITIRRPSKNAAEREQTLQQVANIEAIVQPHDAWTYQALSELLEQDTIQLSVVYSRDNKTNAIDSKIIGYCLYQVVFEQAEILRIGTHPQYHRQGIASLLLTTLHEQLQQNKVESLLLEVRADNRPAIALYEQQAFKVIHRRKDYYQQPYQPAIEALIMQRNYINES